MEHLESNPFPFPELDEDDPEVDHLLLRLIQLGVPDRPQTNQHHFRTMDLFGVDFVTEYPITP